MNSNSQTNSLMMYLIIGVDFMLINILLLLLTDYHPWFDTWSPSKVRTLILLNNLALLISEYFNPPVIHRRVISVGDILNRILRLVLVQSFLAFFFMKSLSLSFVGGRFQSIFCLLYFISILILRSLERIVIKKYRKVGGNSRSVLFIGADSELLNVYHRLQDDASMGYRIMGYYADEEMTDVPEDVELKRLGTLQGLSHFCDQHVIRFYFVPVSVETLGINLKRELLDDMEVYTTYEIPLAVPLNKLIKRTFDIVLSLVFLIPTAILFPFVYVIIKLQSPGPIFFKQARTGLDGRDFNMLKFRSMHVNKDADRLQATKDDPRKYPFGNFMRKSNIDELPQFLNVLKGDMSIVGPRPHMLAHTEQYSQLIDKYMVRHFVKPGLTGWAQVTGFRGETKELWQMEGRVKRDIWYIEHWSIWLDFRIIWMTAKTIFIHDKNAY